MLLIQIPTLNNFNELKQKIAKISLELSGVEFEFIIVDHSKIDYSREIIKYSIDNKFQKINYFKLEKKTSKNERGLASRFGYEKAIELYDNFGLIEIDSDSAHNEKEIIKLYNHAKKYNCDIVIASKYLSKSKVLNRKLTRRFISYTYNFFNKIFFNLKISDTSNGYRFYSKQALINYISLKIIFVTPIAHLLLLVINNIKDLKFSEIDSTYIEDKNSKSSINFKQLFFCIIDYLYLIFSYKIKKIK